MLFVKRNDALRFAELTRQNLEYVENAFKRGEDVHVVTQLATSLLGLIVFPREKHFTEQVESLGLDTLVAQGWPRWQISKGTCETLGCLLRHLRNAVAHGRMTFSSDSRQLDEVVIKFEDIDPHKRDKPVNWIARIGAKDLRTFCDRFVDLLNERIG